MCIGIKKDEYVRNKYGFERLSLHINPLRTMNLLNCALRVLVSVCHRYTMLDICPIFDKGHLIKFNFG